jgi:hypothetical protein
MDVNDLNGTKIVQDGLVLMVAEFMQTFETMWEEMGISSSVHKNRLDVILQYVRSLFVDMINDEKEFMLELKSSIETYERELLDLANELGEVPYQVIKTSYFHYFEPQNSMFWRCYMHSF